MRYLDSINDLNTLKISEELSILIKESSFTKNQLVTIDRYLDSIRTKKTLIRDAFDKGKIEGKLEAKHEEKLETKIEIAKSLKSLGISIDVIIKSTGLSEKEIEQL
jgi:predicted transposase/invertase (TIGR01784 family)